MNAEVSLSWGGNVYGSVSVSIDGAAAKDDTGADADTDKLRLKQRAKVVGHLH